MFSHIGANGPELKTTSVSSISPGGGTGAKSAVSNCILFEKIHTRIYSDLFYFSLRECANCAMDCIHSLT